MTRRFFIAIMAFLFCGAITMSAEKLTDEQRAKAAQDIVKIIEGKQWVFIPESVEFNASLQIDRLRTDQNRFIMKGDEMKIHVDYHGGEVRANMSPRKTMETIREIAEVEPIIPPVFVSKLQIVKQEVDVSKNNKYVKVRLHFKVEETNLNVPSTTSLLELNVNTSDMSATLRCDGLNEDEVYFGNLLQYIEVNE